VCCHVCCHVCWQVLAVVDKSPHYSEMMTLRDVPEHVLREIAHFFSTYKVLHFQKVNYINVENAKHQDSSILI